MRPSCYTEEQLIVMLKEQEAGAATVDVCSKHGYGGMDVSRAHRLKTLDDENARLKSCCPNRCSTTRS